MRKRIDNQTKARVAIEALIGAKTASEIASQYKVHPNMVSKFKGKLLEEAPKAFSNGPSSEEQEKDRKIEELYRTIGELQVANDFLKKKCKEWNL
jgi:transposase-like protein